MIGFPRCDHLNQEDVFSDQLLRPKRDRSTSRQRPKHGDEKPQPGANWVRCADGIARKDHCSWYLSGTTLSHLGRCNYGGNMPQLWWFMMLSLDLALLESEELLPKLSVPCCCCGR